MQALPDAASLPLSLQLAVVNPLVMTVAETLRQVLTDFVSGLIGVASRERPSHLGCI